MGMDAPLIDTLRTVETPESVELDLRAAGPAVRAAAYVVDQGIRFVLYGVAGGALSFLGSVGEGITLIFIFMAEFFYPVAFEVWNHGATPGKAAFGLAVVHDDGTPVSLSASVIRNLLRAADFLPLFYLFGFVATLVDPSFKRLGDLAARTIVVHRDVPDRAPRKVRDTAPLQVPVWLSLEEQRAIMDFSERVHSWTPDRASELAEILERLVGAPGPESTSRLLAMASWIRGRR